MILDYPPIAMPKTLKEWKVVITSVEQGYESTEGWHNYKTSTGTIYRGWDNLWTLKSPTRTSRMGSLSASIAISTVIWQRNADQKRRNEKHKHVLNATRRDTLPKIVKGNKR